MKTPPLLLGATVLFWGWQAGFLVVGVIMAAALEGARLVKARWEFTDEDLTRIWTFCTVLALATAVFAFTASEAPMHLRGFLQHPNFSTQRSAGTASAQAAAAWIRWLPMTFFLFVFAQAFSSRETVPLETFSFILRRRWKKARRLGRDLPRARSVTVAYPYLVVCLFAASMHPAENSTFFAGLCVLLAWALWPQRARRFSPAAWTAALAVAVGLSYFGQRGISQLQRLIENYNPQWFFHRIGGGSDPMQSKTGLGHIGRLKGSDKIVIRLEPKEGGAPPPLLREASYRTYKAQTWYADVSERDFFEVRETNNATFVLLPAKTNLAAVTLACYLEGGTGLLPLPTGSGRLENLPDVILQKSGLGAVLAQGPGLVIFDAHYGPGPTMDFPGNTNDDLFVPPREMPALDEVIAELRLQDQNLPQTLQTLKAFFLNKFTYSTWEGPDRLSKTNDSPLTRFLLRTHSGHCEYFATATVLLLRQLHIPARYAVGYAVHEGSGRNYVVRQRDAHAWCLVWNQSKGTWQDFDTTPASWVEVEAGRASPLQFWSDLWSRLGFEFSRFRWGQTHLRQYFLWALAPVLLVLFYQIMFRRRKQLRNLQGSIAAAAWPGLDSEFYRLEKALVKRGAVRQPGEPLSDWLRRVSDFPGLARVKAPLRSVLRLHYRYRFDPDGLEDPDREALRREACDCLAAVEQHGQTWQQG